MTLANPVFDDQALKRRQARLQSMMAERDLSALVIYGTMADAKNVEYLLGYACGYSMVVLPREGEPVLLVRPRAFLPTLEKRLDIRVEDGGLDFSEPLLKELRGILKAYTKHITEDCRVRPPSPSRLWHPLSPWPSRLPLLLQTLSVTSMRTLAM